MQSLFAENRQESIASLCVELGKIRERYKGLFVFDVALALISKFEIILSNYTIILLVARIA